MWDFLLIVWYTLIGFLFGLFGSIIGGALLQTFGVRFWLTDLMVSPWSFLVGLVCAAVCFLNAVIDEVPGFRAWRRKEAQKWLDD